MQFLPLFFLLLILVPMWSEHMEPQLALKEKTICHPEFLSGYDGRELCTFWKQKDMQGHFWLFNRVNCDRDS